MVGDCEEGRQDAMEEEEDEEDERAEETEENRTTMPSRSRKHAVICLRTRLSSMTSTRRPVRCSDPGTAFISATCATFWMDDGAADGGRDVGVLLAAAAVAGGAWGRREALGNSEGSVGSWRGWEEGGVTSPGVDSGRAWSVWLGWRRGWVCVWLRRRCRVPVLGFPLSRTSNLKVVPTSGLETNESVPPMSSASLRLIDSPMPVPPNCLDVDESAWQKGFITRC